MKAGTMYGVWCSQDVIEEFMIKTPNRIIKPDFEKKNKAGGIFYKFTEPVDLPPNCDVDFKAKREADVEVRPVLEAEP